MEANNNAEEEEKKEENTEMQGGDNDDGEWGAADGDDDDNAGWYNEYEDEEDNDIVKQALEATRKKKELDEQITKVRIAFRPPDFRDGNVARIVGDFTDWIPVTMSMHPVKEID